MQGSSAPTVSCTPENIIACSCRPAVPDPLCPSPSPLSRRSQITLCANSTGAQIYLTFFQTTSILPLIYCHLKPTIITTPFHLFGYTLHYIQILCRPATEIPPSRQTELIDCSTCKPEVRSGRRSSSRNGGPTTITTATTPLSPSDTIMPRASLLLRSLRWTSSSTGGGSSRRSFNIPTTPVAALARLRDHRDRVLENLAMPLQSAKMASFRRAPTLATTGQAVDHRPPLNHKSRCFPGSARSPTTATGIERACTPPTAILLFRLSWVVFLSDSSRSHQMFKTLRYRYGGNTMPEKTLPGRQYHIYRRRRHDQRGRGCSWPPGIRSGRFYRMWRMTLVPLVRLFRQLLSSLLHPKDLHLVLTHGEPLPFPNGPTPHRAITTVEEEGQARVLQRITRMLDHDPSHPYIANHFQHRRIPAMTADPN